MCVSDGSGACVEEVELGVLVTGRVPVLCAEVELCVLVTVRVPVLCGEEVELCVLVTGRVGCLCSVLTWLSCVC